MLNGVQINDESFLLLVLCVSFISAMLIAPHYLCLQDVPFL